MTFWSVDWGVFIVKFEQFVTEHRCFNVKKQNIKNKDTNATTLNCISVPSTISMMR